MVVKSYRLLFLGGLPLAVWARLEMSRQFTESLADEIASRKAWRELARMTIAVCPCGCGLTNDICEEQTERVRRAEEECPF